MAVLSLDRLQCHPGLPESGQAGVPQLVAGGMGQTRPVSGALEDLVQPGHGQRLPATRSFEDHEQLLGAGVRGTFGLQISGDMLEEPV